MVTRMIICLMFCSFAVSAAGANEFGANPTLDSLIRVALEQNPKVQAAVFNKNAAESRAGSEGWLPDPQLTIGFLNLPRTSLGFDETPMSGVSVGLTQSVPWPGKLSAISSIAGLESESKAVDLESRRNRITRMVTSVYFEYSYWTLTREILKENLSLIEKIITVTQTRYANGYGTAQDVLRAQTEKARLENRILMVLQKRSSARVELGWLTDNPETVHASIPAALPPNPIEHPTTMTAESNPILAGAILKTTIAEKKVNLAKSDYWPDLMFGIDYRIRKEVPMDAVRGEDFLSFKVGLKLPLWFFKVQRNKSAAAKQNLLAAKANERAVLSEVEQKVSNVKLMLKSLSERIRQYEDNILPQARATSEAAEAAYEVGRLGFNDFLSVRLDIMNIELEKLELLKQYNQQAAVLRELTIDAHEVR